jgi:hypothetical protein
VGLGLGSVHRFGAATATPVGVAVGVAVAVAAVKVSVAVVVAVEVGVAVAVGTVKVSVGGAVGVKLAVAVAVAFCTETVTESLPSTAPLEAYPVAEIVCGPLGTVVVSKFAVKGGEVANNTESIKILSDDTFADSVTVIGTVPDTIAPKAGVSMRTKEICPAAEQLHIPPPLPSPTNAPHWFCR